MVSKVCILQLALLIASVFFVTIPNVAAASFSQVRALPLGEPNPATAVIDPVSGYAYFATDTTPGKIVQIRLSNFTKAGVLTLNGALSSAVIDPDAGFAYFGTFSIPGAVAKVRLSDFSLVDGLNLNEGEDRLTSAVIDVAGGYAYFGTLTSPGIVVKIRLSDFTRVGNLTLTSGEDYLTSAVIDPAGGYAYFGTDTSPGRVVKVGLSGFARAGALSLEADEHGLTSAVIDADEGYAYFGTNTEPGKVVKVGISNFTRMGALTLNRFEENLRSAVIDPSRGFVYFGATPHYYDLSLIDSRVVKISLASFTRVDSANLWPWDYYALRRTRAAVIDVVGGIAYFSASEIYSNGEEDGGVVAKLQLSSSVPSLQSGILLLVMGSVIAVAIIIKRRYLPSRSILMRTAP